MVISDMQNIVSYNLTNELHSITITRGFCHLRKKVNSHILNYIAKYIKCFCFEWRIMSLFCCILIEKEDQRYLFHINVSNYDDLEDLDILGRALVSSM